MRMVSYSAVAYLNVLSLGQHVAAASSRKADISSNQKETFISDLGRRTRRNEIFGVKLASRDPEDAPLLYP